MRPRLPLGLLMAFVLLTGQGCATLIKGTGQDVRFTTDPPGASIYVDGKFVGTSPVTARVSHGSSKRVMAKLPGHQDAVGQLTTSFSGHSLYLGLSSILVDSITGSIFTLDSDTSHLTLAEEVAPATTAPFVAASPPPPQPLPTVAALSLVSAPTPPPPPPVVAAPPAPASEPLPPLSATGNANSFAVIIGIENYREGLPAASHAVADASAFEQVVSRTFGVPVENTKVLLNERAGKADMESVIEEWLPRNAREPGATVYFFFSGHGAPDASTGAAYLVPYDADPAYLKTRGYSVSTLYATLGKLGAHVFVFLDSCFSGAGGRSVLAAGTRPLVPVMSASSPSNLVVFGASGAAETTGASQRGGHGLFSQHLLHGLRGDADDNHDGNITVSELFQFVKHNVVVEARRQNREQTPTLQVPVAFEQEPLVKGLR